MKQHELPSRSKFLHCGGSLPAMPWIGVLFPADGSLTIYNTTRLVRQTKDLPPGISHAKLSPSELAVSRAVNCRDQFEPYLLHEGAVTRLDDCSRYLSRLNARVSFYSTIKGSILSSASPSLPPHCQEFPAGQYLECCLGSFTTNLIFTRRSSMCFCSEIISLCFLRLVRSCFQEDLGMRKHTQSFQQLRFSF